MEKSKLVHISEADLETAVIYEVNIRQYSEEGTFEAFTRDIPSLKNLGVRILWVMPVHPISKAKRKVDLGSYYAIADYSKINPEFGTEDDFRNLVNTAHEHGIYVILDWVANHTGWDHPWITDHPEYYTQNGNGEIIDPQNSETGESWGWSDVADLNYDNGEMRVKMIDEMLYWIREFDLDGFRCDVAHQVPVDFWEEAAHRLREEKPLFLLAEAEQPELLKNAFDMQYAWEAHHIMNGISQGENNAQDLKNYLEKLGEELEEDDIVMYFTSNHDENTWNGTVFERMGDASEMMAVVSYILPGMPLIYSGQEWDLDKRLNFFEKDTIPVGQNANFYQLYEKLGKLKNEYPALNGGKKAAGYRLLPTSMEECILAMMREKDGRRLLFLANLSDAPQEFSFYMDQVDEETKNVLVDSNWINYFEECNYDILEENVYCFNPWEYKVLVDKLE
ncbi:MAG TPA: alpha-amylase family glycosyl hydrolase [Membranihabitans sp.]|nr:alpha-amylase family glycosyl hydrolase [Membranihabitans sp.]